MKKLIYLLFIVLVIVGTWFAVGRNDKPTDNKQTDAAETQNQEKNKKGKFKTFSGAEFRELYGAVAYPNSAFINEKTLITGNTGTDKHIRKLAESRGYKIRSAPVADNFISVASGMKLQPRAAESWLGLRKSAESQGIRLGLVEAYRSAESQKDIFLSRLGQISHAAVIAGQADAYINGVLKTTALPGYSRHHTGYTVDISCESDPSVLFEQSSCFRWLSADNYIKAKEYGWIPSYPDGGGKQGPDPEAWEYVWVGKDVLRE